ncbi:uncharacterized protein [Palaemon carinicauda]|uniref:uncharacterized protein n=1 Tax=Palaemon carinicauda TaxID=392227 RepID=UPI0035B6989E
MRTNTLFPAVPSLFRGRPPPPDVCERRCHIGGRRLRRCGALPSLSRVSSPWTPSPSRSSPSSWTSPWWMGRRIWWWRVHNWWGCWWLSWRLLWLMMDLKNASYF